MFNPGYNNLPAGSFSTYVTRPDLTPPLLNVNGTGTPGLVFFTQTGANVHQPSMVIADNTGNIVYVNDTFPAPFDLNVQTFNNEQVLTFWSGDVISTHSLGNYYMLDSTLNMIANITTAPGTSGDLHEFNIINNKALFSFYYIQAMNLQQWGGPANGFVYGSGFQQIDLTSRAVLFEWKCTDHISPSQSVATIGSFNGDGSSGAPWDYFHLNSVDIHPTDGTFLISARHTSSIYKIANNSSGTVMWTMTGIGSGKPAGHGDFTLGTGANFEWQHHARWRSATEISIFDNASQYDINNSEPVSRAIRLLLNLANASNLSATLIAAYTDFANPLSGSQGSFSYLPNGQYFVGYGSLPIGAEFNAQGTLVSQYQLSPPGDVEAYRMFKANFTSNPTTKPDIAIQSNVVHMSWNGATQVTQWNVLSGASATSLALVKTVAKTGFETNFTFSAPFNTNTNFTRVDALDATGKLLKSSNAIKGNFIPTFKAASHPRVDASHI